jgi:D-glycero-D-manno-heptose 1,7-bisphosphate phosphatase
LPGLAPTGVVFLDRDGTINLKAPEGDYVKSPEELELLPGAARAIRRLNDAGVEVIIVSNQRGIALGRMTEGDLQAIHAELAARLKADAGARVAAIFHCPHDRGECDCRKPGTGMFERARERFPWIDLDGSVMIGDSASDIGAGRALGMRTVWVGHDAPDLAAAVELILGPETESATAFRQV